MKSSTNYAMGYIYITYITIKILKLHEEKTIEGQYLFKKESNNQEVQEELALLDVADQV